MRGKTVKQLLLAAVAAAAVACSNEQIYNTVQHNQRLECGKLPQAQYEECMRDYDTSYDEYEREQAASGDDRAAPQ